MLEQDVKGWLARLRDVAEDRLPWPGDAMPEPLRQACLASPAAGPAVEAAASVQIDVPPDAVQRVLARPDFQREVQPPGVVYVAHVPGTPGPGAVGNMQSYVAHASNGLFGSVVSLLAASSPGARFHRLVTPPLYETTYRYEPAGDGTSLEVTRRCPGRAVTGSGVQADWHAAGVAAIAGRYKATIERLARAPA